MRKHMNVLMVLVSGIVFVAILYTSITVYISFFFDGTQEPSEQIITEKRAEKGVYWLPYYKVMTENSEHGNYVTKKQFDSLQVGDKIEGYYSEAYSFFTTIDFVYASFIAVPVIILLSFLLLMLIIGAIVSIPIIGRILEENGPKKSKRKKKRHITLSGTLLTIYLVFAVVYCGIYSLNTFNKLNPFGKTQTIAHIADREYVRNSTDSGDYSTYTLLLEYKNPLGHEYIVEKRVLRGTYYKFENESSIAISYKNKQPHNIFVRHHSFSNFISANMSWQTILYLGNLVTLYLIYVYYSDTPVIQKMRRKKRK